MEPFSEPEILKTPLEQTILLLKGFGVEDVLRFPFVTKPETEVMRRGIRGLVLLGGLEVKNKHIAEDDIMRWNKDETKIT